MICSGANDGGEPKSDPPEKKSDKDQEDKNEKKDEPPAGPSFESTHL